MGSPVSMWMIALGVVLLVVIVGVVIASRNDD